MNCVGIMSGGRTTQNAVSMWWGRVYILQYSQTVLLLMLLQTLYTFSSGNSQIGHYTCMKQATGIAV